MISGRTLRRIDGAGYTITEVMIVLAVTTLMFVAVVAAFAGRQGRTEFTQAVRNYEAQLQTTISEVANGVYDATDCAGTASGVSFASNLPGSCIFVGKAYTIASNRLSSNISTLVGRRQAGTPPVEVTAYTQTAATASAVQTYTHTFQLQLRRIVQPGNRGITYTAFGFIVPFAGSSDISTDQSAGSRQVELYALRRGLSFPGGLAKVPDGVTLCLLGQNGQRAELTIGAEGSDSLLVSNLDTPNEGDCRE